MKPIKFNIINNFRNSINGLKDIFCNEAAFRIEVLVFIIMTLIASSMPISIESRAILILSLPIVLLAEIINSAIERAVDTATMEYDENAKRSKDAASTIVLIAILWVVAIWCSVLYFAFKVV